MSDKRSTLYTPGHNIRITIVFTILSYDFEINQRKLIITTSDSQ